MKFKQFMLAGLFFTMMTSCQNELDENEVHGNEGDAYMSLSIEMPNVEGGRAIDENGTTSEGTAGEQKITSLKLFVYDATSGELQNSGNTDFDAGDLQLADINKTITYTIPSFKIKGGEKKVLVIVNPLDGKFTDQTDMSEAMKLSEDEINAVSTDGKFMMTNVNREPDTDGMVSVIVDGTETNPTSVTVEVERVVAKIEDTTNNYEFSIANTNGDKVVFQKVALINGNTKLYPVMMVRENEKDKTHDYVEDPNFENQNEKTVNDFYSKVFTESTFNDTDNKYVKPLSSEESEANALFYTLENTMISNEQMNSYTTGLYYQAQYKLGGQAGNVYKYGENLYTFDLLSNAADGLGLQLGGLTNDSSVEEFADIAVTKFVDGVCYYKYWIRHIDNPDAAMGAMEFAVVRNNHYLMNINSVKGIGENKPTDPDPTDPDENADSFLDVKVKVLPWVVRRNNIDF